MSAKMEYEGKDVAEAIKNACDKLKLPGDNLDIEVLSAGSAGVLGLFRKQAKIRVSIKGDAAKTGKTRAERVAAHPGGEPVVALSAEVLETIKADLRQLLELMGFPSEVEVVQEEKKVLGRISGEHLDAIVGDEGQTLDGLQYLLRKIISRKYPGKIMLTLDAGDFRENRLKELETMARDLADEVKQTGKTRTIPALNPAERRIVHMVLQSDTTIRSRSVGDGLFKKILIYLPGKGRKKSAKRRHGGRSSH